MARPGLLFDLQSAIDEAQEERGRSGAAQCLVEGTAGPALVTRPGHSVPDPVQEKNSFLVVFEPPTGGSRCRRPGEVLPAPLSDDERTVKDKQIAQLKQELAATKEYLQSIIETQEATNEELQSANEEIQSGNEELQSTNEELQTSKEELESANEELHTVNEEMQHRNELLTQLNNDLTNLLNSVNLPLYAGARSERAPLYSAGDDRARPDRHDIGRPIPRLKLKIDIRDLEKKMLDVIRDVQAKQFKVQDHEGKWCNLRVPYRTLDNRIDGVVLSVVTELGFPTGQLDGVDGRMAISARTPSKEEL